MRLWAGLAMLWLAGAMPGWGADIQGKTYLTVEGPTGTPAAIGTPVLQSITALYDVIMPDGFRVDVQPQFHFVAPKGNAVFLHRELMETDSAITAAGIVGAKVSTPAEQQMAGAVIRGGWPCGPGHYHVSLRAWLEDADGNRGNALQYTIHCHELVMF